MATISDARAVFGLSALASPTSTNASGSINVGVAQSQTRLESANVAYSVRGIIASGNFVLTHATGSTAGSTTFVQGAAQVETATVTAAGGITTSGNATVTVTAAGMTGTPKAISVALTTTAHTTATLIATAIKAALNADTAVTALFTVGGTGATVSLTRKVTATFTVPGGTLNFYADNDATLNIALADDTCVGITTAATSTNTTAGVITSGVKIYDGDGLDVEGVAIPTISSVSGILIQCQNGASVYSSTTGEGGAVFGTASSSHVGTRLFTTSSTTSLDFGTITFNDDTAPADITVTVIGATA